MSSYSIQKRLIRNILVSVGVVFLAAGLFADLILTRWLVDEYDKRLLTKAQVLETLVKDQINFIEFDFADEFMPEFEAEENPEYFEIWQPGFGLIERSNSLSRVTNDQFNSVPILPHFITESKIKYGLKDIKLPDGRSGRMIMAVFYPQIHHRELRTIENLKNQKKIVLTVAKERESLDDLVLNVHLIFISSALLVLYIIAVIINYAVRSDLSPLILMKKQVAGLDVKSLNQRVQLSDKPDELMGFVSQFNLLLERIELSFEREQRFSADVAHDLKTPLAEIKNLVELSLKWPDDEEIKHDFHHNILASVSQIQQLLNNLLMLARCDNKQITLSLEKIDLMALIERTCQRYQATASEKNISIKITELDALYTESSEIELSLIIDNVIANAMNYATEGSTVNVSVDVGKKQLISLSVSNKTYELTEIDLEQMGDRFWRKNPSRTSSNHAGLGLSLVDAYTEILGLSTDRVLIHDVFTLSINGLKKV